MERQGNQTVDTQVVRNIKRAQAFISLGIVRVFVRSRATVVVQTDVIIAVIYTPRVGVSDLKLPDAVKPPIQGGLQRGGFCSSAVSRLTPQEPT